MDLKVCRFCLTPDELSNIFECTDKTSSLQVQILSCTGSEVFDGDGMPGFMCKLCHKLIEVFHGYKQNCKKAEVALKQFIITKRIPSPFSVSLDPFKPFLVSAVKPPVQVSNKATSTNVKVQSKSTQCEQKKDGPLPQEPVMKPVGRPGGKRKRTDENIEESPKGRTAENKDEGMHFKIVEVEPVKPKSKSLTPKRTESLKRAPKKTNEADEISFDVIEVVNLKTASKPVKEELKTPPSKKAKPKLLNRQEGIKMNLPTIENVKMKQLDTTENGEVLVEIVEMDPVPVVFACSYCRRSFPLRQQLEIHEQNHFRERTFCCDKCDRSFMSKHDLAKHLQTHLPKSWECVICHKTFARSNILKKHEETHAEELRFHCGVCEKKFIIETELDAHIIQEHGVERKFKCDVCNKGFKYKQGLERHQASQHTSSSEFACEHCHLEFPTAGKLSRHLQTHAGARRFPCKFCVKVFKYSHHLSRHVRGHENGTLREEKDATKQIIADLVDEEGDDIELEVSIDSKPVKLKGGKGLKE